MLLTRLCLAMYATPRMLKLLLFCLWPSQIVVPFDRSILIVLKIGLFVNCVSAKPAQTFFLGSTSSQSATSTSTTTGPYSGKFLPRTGGGLHSPTAPLPNCPTDPQSHSLMGLQPQTLRPWPSGCMLSSRLRPQVCAFCGIHKDKLQRCSRCTVTYYCSHKCQKADWKAGHKAACTAAADVIYGGPASASQAPGAGAGDRPSFVFDVLQNDARKFAPVASVMNFNTGTVTTTADPKAMGSSGIACDKMQKPKNVHGNAEFIVKLQPPVQVWAALGSVLDGGELG